MSTDIGFHKVHDSNIVLLHNNSIARKMNGEDLHGTCFTNRNIRLGEKIYIRVIETHPKLSGSMDFGLTNYDPAKIVRSPADHFHKLRKDKGSKLLEYAPDFNDVFCFTLSGDSLCVSINDVIHKTIDVKAVSTGRHVWFSFDLFGKIRAIEITMNEPKKKAYHSFIQQLAFKIFKIPFIIILNLNSCIHEKLHA